MKMRQSVKTCLSRYFQFSGRATRSEYWWFFAFFWIGLIIVATLDSVLFNATETSLADGTASVEFNGPFSILFILAMTVPLITAGWRRMHDTGRSGLFLLYPIIVTIGIASFVSFAGDEHALASIVIAGAILVLVASPLLVFWWLSRPSQSLDNIYGPKPHEVSP